MSELHVTAIDTAGRSWPLLLKPATRLTAELDEPPEALPRSFTAVRARLGATEHALGPAEVIKVPGRLVLLCTNPVDWEALFARAELRSGAPGLAELPLLLAQREQVTPEFRALVSDIAFDLTVFRKFLDQYEKGFLTEQPEIREAGRRHLLERAGPNLHALLDRFLTRLHEVVSPFTPDQHATHGYYLRQQLWSFILAAPFMRRTNLKPRGYAGDAVMMEMIYDQRPDGDSAFAQLLHLHPVRHPAAEAVRNRRVIVPLAARAHLQRTPGPFRVLSVACGPARELNELFKDLPDPGRVSLALLDQDEEALAAARETVAAIDGLPARTTYFLSSVRTLLRAAELQRELGQFQFIYSMGLFDYLTRPVARAVLARLYELLAPGGVLFVGNYHVHNPSRFYMAYWLDWNLNHRSEREFVELTAGLGGAPTITFDPTRSQMFLSLEKPR